MNMKQQQIQQTNKFLNELQERLRQRVQARNKKARTNNNLIQLDNE